MGYKIREFRKKVGLTQEKLATATGVSRATICALENNPNYSTNIKTLLKIATALGTTVDQIFFDESV